MLSPDVIARRRVIERIVLFKGKGEIWLNGKIKRLLFDDLVDLTQAVEMIDLEATGKVLRPQFRTPIKNRAACQIDKLEAGDADLYDGSQGPAPFDVGKWYLRVEIDGNVWHNWFGRLDELVKLLNVILREAQGDPYQPNPSIIVPGVVGHA